MLSRAIFEIRDFPSVGESIPSALNFRPVEASSVIVAKGEMPIEAFLSNEVAPIDPRLLHAKLAVLFGVDAELEEPELSEEPPVS